MSATSQSVGVRQWLRQVSLVAAASQNSQGIELGNLHITFRITAQTTTAPATLQARIYNVAPTTAAKIRSFPTITTGNVAGSSAQPNSGRVVLQAGYSGNFGIVFSGEIMQTRQGRESPADTYVDIFAGDGDAAHVWSVINTSLAAGYTQADLKNAIDAARMPYGVVSSALPDNVDTSKQAPRGKPMFGMARDYHTDFASTNGLATWTSGGTTQWWHPQSPYKPNDVVVINSATGMVGLPQQTDWGITVRMLLNPSVGAGSLLKIDNTSIQRAQFTASYDQSQTNLFLGGSLNADTNADGLYRVLAVELIGDTRGTEWYTDALCIATAPTGSPNTGPTTQYLIAAGANLPSSMVGGPPQASP